MDSANWAMEKYTDTLLRCFESQNMSKTKVDPCFKHPVDLVWLNKASIPNLIFQGNLEVDQIYFTGVGGWSHGDYNANSSSR